MKTSELPSNVLRFISAGVMALALVGIIALESWVPYIHVVRWVSVIVVLGAIYEMFRCLKNVNAEVFSKHASYFIIFTVMLFLMLVSAYFVGGHPWIMLWLLMIIVGADVGGWLFGLIFGGDKMWERLSAHKTWSGQIGGIICGTAMSLLYGKIGVHNFMPELIWIGISVSLLSQYGDLTASFVKRRLNIKDFSNLLPGHGGIMDRFDGWIYVLPLIWFMIR